MKGSFDFCLVLLVGAILGGVLTLLGLEKYNFGDLGGLLAGLFTAGLFVLAWFTTNIWKTQQDRQLKRELLINLHSKLIHYFYEMKMLAVSNRENGCDSELSSKQVDRVLLSAGECDGLCLAFKSISSNKIASALTPDFSYQPLSKKLTSNEFDHTHWFDVIASHELEVEHHIDKELIFLTH